MSSFESNGYIQVKMSFLTTFFTHFRVFVSYGPGLAFLLLLHESIRIRRPDIVDREHRVRDIATSEILSEYDFIVVGGGSAGQCLCYPK